MKIALVFLALSASVTCGMLSKKYFHVTKNKIRKKTHSFDINKKKLEYDYIIFKIYQALSWKRR